MKFVLSASRLMTAKEVLEACKEVRENLNAVAYQEAVARAAMYNHFFKKEKAAS